VSAGCPKAKPVTTSSNSKRFKPDIYSPPVAKKFRDCSREIAPSLSVMWLILRGTNHIDAQVRAQGFGHHHVLPPPRSIAQTYSASTASGELSRFSHLEVNRQFWENTNQFLWMISLLC
jgi:hypothetical protein